jgi:hypothetical protein
MRVTKHLPKAIGPREHGMIDCAHVPNSAVEGSVVGMTDFDSNRAHLERAER